MQIASYSSAAPAESLREKLARRGYDVRTVHDVSAWKVRIGRYPTHAAAEGALRKLTADLKLTGGWVVEEEAR